jgi:hypothetical protein
MAVLNPRRPAGGNHRRERPGNDSGRQAARNAPEDQALAWTMAEHVHCGEPMRVLVAGEQPITQPLMILPAGGSDVPPVADIITYRCRCGFTLDEIAD